MEQRTPVAVFDFDGTITRRDTLLPFLLFVFDWPGVLLRSIPLLPVLLGYAVKLVDNGVAKERVIRHLFDGVPELKFQEWCERFAEERLPALVRFNAMTRLSWHRQQGHRCIIVSASMEDYLKPWAEQNGIGEVLATRLSRYDNGTVQGHFLEGNCYGEQKVARLAALLGDLDNYEIYAYGDSRGDRELLAVAEHPFYRVMPG